MKRARTALLAAVLAIWPSTGFGDSQPQIGEEGRGALSAVSPVFAATVTNAATEFLDSLNAEQREQALFSFEDAERISGRDTASTPAFCAVLAWCVGWGLTQCSLTYPQQRALHGLLATALSDSGYQTLLAILNRHRVIGELEDHGDANFVDRVSQKCGDLNADSVFNIPENCQPDDNPRSDYIVVGGNLAPDGTGAYQTSWAWPNGSPGLQKRRKHFCDFAIAFFGRPGSELWSFRFEGHHMTVSLTLERDPKTGNYTVHSSPLFLGSFPIVVPPSPDPDNIESHTTWVAGQAFMGETANHAREFLNALPDRIAQGAHISSGQFEQSSPLLQDAVPPWMTTSLLADAEESEPSASGVLSTADLSETAKWHLHQLYGRYFATMHPDIGEQYRSALERLIDSNTRLSVLWAGGRPLHSGENLFLRVLVGPLLLEIRADNQWSTQHPQVPKANHLHSMFRDLSFAWDFDAARELGPHHGNNTALSPGTVSP